MTLKTKNKLKRKQKSVDVKRNETLKKVWDQIIAKTIDANRAHQLITEMLCRDFCYHESRIDHEFNDGLVPYIGYFEFKIKG